MGAAISRAGANRTTPLATATLVLAANAPDVDVSAYFAGEYAALAVRRGVTHGVPALLILPFVVVGVMLAWDRWIRRRFRPEAPPARAGPLVLWSAVGLATHPVLDWMNIYGMRWWLPFDGAWTHGDALFIVDPWIWLALGGAVFLSVGPTGWGRFAWGALAAAASALVVYAPTGSRVPVFVWFAGLAGVMVARSGLPAERPGSSDAVGAGGGHPVPPPTASSSPATRIPRLALTGCAVYMGLMVTSDALGRRHVRRAAEAAGLDVRDVLVAPLPADPFSAELEIRTPEAFVHGTFHWLRSPRALFELDGRVPLLRSPSGMDAARVDALLAAARMDPDVRDYLTWSRLPYASVEPAGAGGWLVRFGDARYDRMPGAGGLASVEVTVR